MIFDLFRGGWRWRTLVGHAAAALLATLELLANSLETGLAAAAAARLLDGALGQPRVFLLLLFVLPLVVVVVVAIVLALLFALSVVVVVVIVLALLFTLSVMVVVVVLAALCF